MASSDAVAQFVAITGADADAARFYLESAGGDAEAAISAYFESGGAAGSGQVDDQDEDAGPADDPEFLPGVLLCTFNCLHHVACLHMTYGTT